MRLRDLRFLLLLLSVLVAACADQKAKEGSSVTPADELIVQAANYELLAGTENRFIAGLLTPDQLLVSFGSVEIQFSYLGTEREEQNAEPGPQVTATFLPIEEADGGESDTPVATSGSQGRGVYSADVAFDRAGFWAADVTAQLEGEELEGRAIFEVVEDPLYPAVGERAPRTDNLTIHSDDAPREAIDSRARDGDPVPDATLHQMTIAQSIRRGEPALVVIATPVYCVSRFCGPITDMVADLQRRYADRANFIHVEVWRNFEKSVLNAGAAEWIYPTEDTLTEPWVFLIDDNGRIAARWDNVATREEIEPLLRDLPRRDP